MRTGGEILKNRKRSQILFSKCPERTRQAQGAAQGCGEEAEKIEAAAFFHKRGYGHGRPGTEAGRKQLLHAHLHTGCFQDGKAQDRKQGGIEGGPLADGYPEGGKGCKKNQKRLLCELPCN